MLVPFMGRRTHEALSRLSTNRALTEETHFAQNELCLHIITATLAENRELRLF